MSPPGLSHLHHNGWVHGNLRGKSVEVVHEANGKESYRLCNWSNHILHDALGREAIAQMVAESYKW
jgi:hypothetical protein